MKKFKLIDVYNIYNILMQISDRIAPLKITYWITKNISIFKDEYLTYVKNQREIWSDLLYTNEDGSIVHKDENGNYKYNCTKENEAEFVRRMDELNNFEVDIEPYSLNMDELLKNNITFEIEPKIVITLSNLGLIIFD